MLAHCSPQVGSKFPLDPSRFDLFNGPSALFAIHVQTVANMLAKAADRCLPFVMRTVVLVHQLIRGASGNLGGAGGV
jgi:hypothetical protein